MLKVFALKKQDGDLADLIIQAEDEAKALGYLLPDEVSGKLLVGDERLAKSMNLAAQPGRYDGALSRWISSPSNLFGDMLVPPGTPAQKPAT